MKVLVACEESQRVCRAFRMKGHEAYSCDLKECSGYLPQYHIRANCLPLLNGNRYFTTQDGTSHAIEGKWDLIIAHPPCTYLATSGNRWFSINRYGNKAIKRMQLRTEAINFFMCFVNADCDRIAIENPVGIMSRLYRKPDQIINPYEFGHTATKKTCLWLKGLPTLKPTKIVEPELVTLSTGKKVPKWDYNALHESYDERQAIRSRTFWGIAKAMSEQWGE